jgi:Spy/CpxP family protein refolding chaperone
MAFSQSAPAHPGHRAGQSALRQRLAADLNLTDAQKQQAHTIFSASRQAAQPVEDQIRQTRQALAGAVKSGASDADIDKLSNSLGPLLAQESAIRAKSFARFYGTLTPDQKDKLGDRFNQMMSGMGRWRAKASQQPAVQ